MAARNDPSPLQIVLDELRDFRKEMRAEISSTTRRIGELENWQANTTGKITVIGALAGILGSVIILIMKHWWPQ